MNELRIDPEFRDKIPPLTDDEFKRLEENILSDGEVYEPICVWNGVIVDGHNRYKIVQSHPEIPFKTKSMEFDDKWEAFEWMYRKQLGRRNLTEAQKDYMVGKMYEARKKSVGKHTGNQYTEMESGQNVHIPDRQEIKDGTAGRIGKEFGMTSRTVRRNEKFAKGLDALKEVSPEAADKILKGESDVSKVDVAELRDQSIGERKDFANKVLNPSSKGMERKKKEVDTKSNNKRSEAGEKIVAGRNLSKRIDEIDKMMSDTTRVCNYTEKDAVEEFEVIMDEFMSKLRRVIQVRSNVVKGNEIIKAMIIEFSEQLKELRSEI